jgi:hypothetical protein
MKKNYKYPNCYMICKRASWPVCQNTINNPGKQLLNVSYGQVGAEAIVCNGCKKYPKIRLKEEKSNANCMV